MELFKIFGTLALNGQDAFNKDTDNAISKGKKLASAVGSGLAKAAKVGAVAVGAAATAVAGITKKSIESFAEYEQLAGGMQKIFDGMDTSQIATDAANAYKDLGMSANEYLATINDVGAGFAATMGAEAGYEAAKKGLTAISDYASGTGKNLNELSQKFTMITRSTSSYQSIADQFSGILPATSAGFLEQAQAAGFLSTQYKTLTEVPINEYQQAVTNMLEQGVEALNLTGNTANEASTTISGSLAMTKAAWSNWVTSLADDNANVQQTTQQLIDSVITSANNILPAVETVLTTLISSLQTQLPTIIDTILEFITSNLPQLVTAGAELLLALVTGLVEAIPDLVAAIPQIITGVVETLVDSWPTIREAGGQFARNLWDGFTELLSTLFPGLSKLFSRVTGETLDEATANMETWATDAETAATEATNAAAQAVLTSGELIPVDAETPVSVMAEVMAQDTSMEEAGTEAVNNAASQMISAVSTAGFDSAGKTAMTKFATGINSMSGVVMNAVNSIADAAVARINQALQQIQSMAAGAAASIPQHAMGLNYVPYDNYLAYLHKGEAVLTAEEATAWRAGKTPENVTAVDSTQGQSGGNGGGWTINQYIETVPQTPVEFAAATEAYFEQARWAMA